MASGNAIQGPSYLDPIFNIPEGLINYQHSNVPDGVVPDYLVDESNADYYVSEDGSYAYDEAYVVDDGDADLTPEIDVPNDITILTPHTIRTQLSGMQVVDLVVDVEDIPGAVNYEFRIVKM